MSLACRLKGHDPSPDEICNGPRCFTRCRRCAADLVKQGEAWHVVPKGFRVVWPTETPPEEPAAADQAPPAEEVPTAPPALPAAAADPADGALILICDDDPLVADLLSHRLLARGYRVSVAADGREALERVAEARPDAILLDAMMPMVDGYEVLRRLRADEATTASIPIIMLTARKQEDDIVSALGLGANDFVVKPFIPEELMSRLARLLAA